MLLVQKKVSIKTNYWMSNMNIGEAPKNITWVYEKDLQVLHVFNCVFMKNKVPSY